jgi:outer membrane protein OmpA-like peptidoglycan-associated protein
MKYSILLVLFAVAFNGFSQIRKLKKADQYYQKLSYSLAIPVYEKLRGSKMDSPQMQSKLAFSYYQIGNMKLAVEQYKSVFEKASDVVPEQLFYYAQALKQTGDFNESNKQMAIFNEKKTTDSRGKAFKASPDYLQKIEANEAHVSVSLAEFNSPVTDFGGYTLNKTNQLLFVSARKNSLTKSKWLWNGENFLDYFSYNAASNEVKSNRQVNSVNSKYHEGPMCFNADESVVYFTRNNLSKGKARKDKNGIQNLSLMLAKVAKNGSFETIQSLAINSKEYSVGHPAISTDGKTLFFVSDMPGGFGGADIYSASILADGTLGTPVNLGSKINTEGQELFPSVFMNQLFFASDGQLGLGGLDIFVAEMRDGSVKAVQHGGPTLNSSSDDFGIIFKEDGQSGYFSSNRIGGIGGDDIYHFTFLKPYLFNVTIKGSITDKSSGFPLANAQLIIYDENNTIVENLTTDEFGNYSIEVAPKTAYKLDIKVIGFENQSIDIAPLSGTFIADGQLSKPVFFGVTCLVTEANSKEAINEVIVTLTELKSATKSIFQTATSGEIKTLLPGVQLDDVLTFELTLKKAGYVTKTVQKQVKVTQSGYIDLNQELDLSLIKLEIGLDISKLIDVKPIYFDLGKWDIRATAKVELDKIIKIMNENPTLVIELGSHTDCRSSAQFNLKLSDKRAKASATYIKSKISKPERIYGKGYGESKLLNGCACEGTVKATCSEEEHQLNRRTEFKIIKF